MQPKTDVVKTNPGGAVRVSVTPTLLEGSDPEDGTYAVGLNGKKVTLYQGVNGDLYYNNTLVGASLTIASFNPALLAFDPQGAATTNITGTFNYQVYDAADAVSLPKTVTLPYIYGVTISGTVWNDANGNATKEVSESFTEAGSSTLTAYLVGSDGNIAASSDVDGTTGAYSFLGNQNTSYTVRLSNVAGATGVANTTAPVALPTDWVYTGVNLGNSANTTNKTGIITVATTTSNIINQNFGVEKKPLVVNNTDVIKVNPGGATALPVNGTLLQGSDLEDGTYANGLSGKKVALTAGVGGALFYNGNPVSGTMIFTNFVTTGLTFDPAGTTQVATTGTFTYAVYDAADVPSDFKTITLPYSAPISISGNVWVDANGNAVNNGSPEVLTNAGGLNAVLTDAAGVVITSQAILAGGTYNFTNVVPGVAYKVVLTTATVTAGTPLTTATLPTNWVNTGTNLNTIASTTNKTGIIDIAASTSNVVNQNFGIEQRPTVSIATDIPRTNPGGNNTVAVTSTLFTGSDPEDGTYPNNLSGRAVTLSAVSNANLFYNGNPVSGSLIIPSFNPTLVTIDPTAAGATTGADPVFSYAVADNAGVYSDPKTITVPFTAALVSISGIVWNDFDGNIAINGTEAGTNASSATLTAYLVNASGNVVASSVVNATSGAYSFANVAPNTAFTVRLSNTGGTPNGNPAPAASLPTSAPWVNTGEAYGANNGAGTGTKTSNPGVIPVTTALANVTGANFGIERRPTAIDVSTPIQVNPGGTATVVAPTLSGTDPEDGAIGSGKTMQIVAFTSNNFTLYYDANGNGPEPGEIVTPGQIITNYIPSRLLLDPNDGALVTTFTYHVIDAAGVASVTPANAQMSFSAAPVTVSGTVFNDANGNIAIDGLETGTNAGSTTLTAYLVSGGNVVSSAVIAANGTYTLSGASANGTYSVVLSNTGGVAAGNPAPAPSIPTSPNTWINTGETYGNNNGAGTGPDPGTPGVINVNTGLVNVTGVNFGIERLPVANNVSLPIQVNPGGSVAVQAPTLEGNDPEDGTLGAGSTVKITSSVNNGVLYYDANGNGPEPGEVVASGQIITNYDPAKLLVDPIDGAVTVTFNYVFIDAAGKEGITPATATIPFSASPVTVSGTVWNDADGSISINGTEQGTEAGSATLTAYLVNAGGNVVSSSDIATNGTYTLPGAMPNTTYTVILSNVAGIPSGNPAPAIGLPSSAWVNTGETYGANNAEGSGTKTSDPGSVPVTTNTVNVTGVNFGLNRRPTANDVTELSQVNPGGTNTVPVPGLGGSDPEDGVMDSGETVQIVTLPTGQGILYYDLNGNGAEPGEIVTAGQIIPNYDPAKLLIDPVDGAVTAVFTYHVIDKAGVSSLNPATVTIPFTAAPVSVSGTVWADANGNVAIDGTETGTNTGSGTLTAYLVNTGGNVVSSAVVAANGTYTLPGAVANTSYTVVLSNTAGIPAGSAAPAESLPSTDWTHTGETFGTNNGAGSGTNTGLPGVIAVTTGLANVTDVNFGINQRPVAVDVTIPSQVNPGGSATVIVAGLGGTDPEQGPLTSGATVTIVTIPSNGTLYYDANGNGSEPGEAIVAGQIIPNFDPTKLLLDPNDGDQVITFTYTIADAAGATDLTPATVTATFTAAPVSISGTVWNDANGNIIIDNSEAGTDAGSATLTAYLINGGNVIAVSDIAGNGTYSFANATANTDYTVVLSNNSSIAIGSAAPASSLPSATWVNTGAAFGVNNGAGTGTQTGTPGVIQVSTGLANVTGVDFGIEQTPTADYKSGTIGSSPTVGTAIPVDGTVSGAAALTGSDPEDQPGSAGLNGKTVWITALPANTELWYAGSKINFGTDGTTAPSPTNPFVINGLIPADLQIRFTAPGVSSTSFNYAYVDAAGKASPPATYALSFGSLPVTLARFVAEKEGNTTRLNWITTSESNSERFDVQHSVDGKQWNTIGSVDAKGESAETASYNFVHAKPANAANLYRLKMIDLDGTFAFSMIRSLNFSVALKTSFYPNPAVNKLNIDIEGASLSDVTRLTMYSVDGKVVFSATRLSDSVIDVTEIQAGAYVMSVVLKNGSVQSSKIIIVK